MLIHSNSRPHKCEYCTITFRTRGHLKIHQQVHLRESKKHGVSPCDIKTRKEKTKLLPLLKVIEECNTNERIEVMEAVRRVDRLVSLSNFHIKNSLIPLTFIGGSRRK